MHRLSTSDIVETNLTIAKPPRPVRVAYFVSHPIQYQAPLLRRIAQEPDIDLTVFFSSDLSVRAYKDAGFGVHVHWDIPLLDGYKYEFLPRMRASDTLGFAKPLNWGIFHRLRKGRFDVAWVFPGCQENLRPNPAGHYRQCASHWEVQPGILEALSRRRFPHVTHALRRR